MTSGLSTLSQCKLRCAKAPRITQCHSLLLHGERGQLAPGVTQNHHGTTHSTDTGGTGGDEAPAGAGAPGGDATAPSVPDTSTDRISGSL